MELYWCYHAVAVLSANDQELLKAMMTKNVQSDGSIA